MADSARQEVEELLSNRIQYHHQFQGRENAHIEQLLDLLQSHPPLALETFTEERFTPLEFMITRRLSLDVIQEFCGQHPRALCQESSSSITEGLPLHVACDLVISLTYTNHLIPFLVESYPQAAAILDKTGNLPLHKLLRKYSVRLRPHLIHDHIDCIVTELQALLRANPESILVPGNCHADMEPLEFVLSVYANILHPRLLGTMLECAPSSLTKLQFQGSLGGHGVLTAQCGRAFEPIMPQLETIQWSLTRSAQYEPAGWSCFFRNVGLCQSLQQLDIFLPTPMVADDQDCHAITMETLAKLKSLSTLRLSFTRNHVPDETGRRRIANLAQPIAGLLRHGTLRDLAVYSTVPEVVVDPIPILAAAIHSSNLQTLELRPCPPELDLTSLLVELLGAENSKLTSLALNTVGYRRGPIFQTLARNNALQSLRLPNLLTTGDDDDRELRLSQILQHHNTALRSVYCLRASRSQRGSRENQQIQHYTLLNRFGRGRLRHMSCTRPIMVEQLTSIVNDSDLQRKENAIVSVLYGILREVPMIWSA